MALLDIVKDVCGEVGVSVPSSVIGNTDANVVQVLRLLNREGKWLARIHDWQVLRKEGSFTTVAANQQVANIKSFTDTSSASVTDLDRIVPKTMWDRTAREQIGDPVTAQRYQGDLANVTVSTRYRYIIRGNALFFTPMPPISHSVYFEYIKIHWCQSSGGTGKTSFSVDTDTGILDEDLLTQGALWRFLKAKSLDYAEEFRRYEHLLSALTGQESPAADLMAVPPEPFDLSEPRVPEGNWS